VCTCEVIGKETPCDCKSVSSVHEKLLPSSCGGIHEWKSFRNEKAGGKKPITNKQGIIMLSTMNGLSRLKPTTHCRHIIMSPVSP